jgi:hypothetical protein
VTPRTSGVLFYLGLLFLCSTPLWALERYFYAFQYTFAALPFLAWISHRIFIERFSRRHRRCRCRRGLGVGQGEAQVTCLVRIILLWP